MLCDGGSCATEPPHTHSRSVVLPEGTSEIGIGSLMRYLGAHLII